MRLYLLVPLLVASAVTSSFGQDKPNSILTNGDLESGNTDWAVGKGVTIEADGANHFLRLQSPEPNVQVQAYRKVNLPKGVTKLKLSFRVQYEDIKAGAQNWHTGRLVMHFLDANGKPLKPEPSPFAFKGSSNGWTEKTAELTVPEGAVTLEFMPALFQVEHGTLDIDDIVIVPAD